jgi:acyl-CoA thioesterase
MLKYEFDTDTAVESTAEGRYRGRVEERWNVGMVANGGYAMAIGMRALGQALAAGDPLTVTAHFLRPTLPGPVDVETEVVKRGRRFATGTARLLQGGKEAVRLLGTYGDVARQPSPTRITAQPPVVPPAGQGITRPDSPLIAGRYDHRFAAENLDWLQGKRSDLAEIRGAVRFHDGRMPDALSLAAIADSFPPPVFSWIDPTWVPTLELTLHVRAQPKSEWLSCVFRTRFLFGGLLEEDGELWDETGQLVALSRQLAMVPA